MPLKLQSGQQAAKKRILPPAAETRPRIGAKAGQDTLFYQAHSSPLLFLGLQWPPLLFMNLHST